MNMNLKYRTKSQTIEAFQMTPERRQDNRDWPNWMHEAWNREPGEPDALFPTEKVISEDTISITKYFEGKSLPVEIPFGHWLIWDGKGISLCPPDTFADRYEVNEDIEIVSDPVGDSRERLIQDRDKYKARVEELEAQITSITDVYNENAPGGEHEDLLKRVKDEWHDFKMIMDHCREAYMELTGGQVSNILTLPSEVIAVAHDLEKERIKEAMEDDREEMEETSEEEIKQP